MRIILGFIGIGFGIFLVMKSYFLTNALGIISFAEQYLGSGGTYKFYKLLGVAFVILSVMYMFNRLQFSFLPHTGP